MSHRANMIGYGGIGATVQVHWCRGQNPLCRAPGVNHRYARLLLDRSQRRRGTPRTSRAIRWVGVVAVAIIVGSASPPVSAQTQQDLDNARSERDEVREDAAAVADRIDQLGDRAEDLAAELGVLEITISAIDSRLETATQAAKSTERDVVLVADEIAELEVEQSSLNEALIASVVEQYIDGHAVKQGTFLTAESPVDWSMQRGLFELVTTDITAVQDQLRVIEARLEDAHDEAALLAEEAQLERDEVTELAAAAAAAHTTQAEVLGKVSERLDRRLAEAEALAAIDLELSEEIRRGEEVIARRLAVARAKAREATEQDASQAEGGGDGGTGDSTADRIARPDDIVNVRGINIHHSIADQLLALINAAEAAGFALGGGGWRSTERQIDLRIQNCGSTDYLIFDAPSEACFPPTARPASSNHEAGLAVDFTSGGRAIIDRNSSAFLWLAANAPRYGFYNLWSEPWHWSIDGT